MSAIIFLFLHMVSDILVFLCVYICLYYKLTYSFEYNWDIINKQNIILQLIHYSFFA